MRMNGELLYSIADLKRCFSIDELLYSYETINEHLKKVHKKIGQQPQKEL